MDERSLRLERLERAALADLHAAADAGLRADLGLAGLEIGGAFVSVAAKEASIVVNRALGLGVASPAEPEDVADITRRYRDAGVSRYFLALHPKAGPATLASALRAEGLGQTRGWEAFVRAGSAPADVATELDVREVGPEHADDFGRIAAEGFGLSERAAAWLGRLTGRARWRVFMTFDGAEPAGAGALFVHDGAAWLDWGATTAKHRRRGSQTAVLAARIAAAAEFGCDLLATETGEEVPGEDQRSYRNILGAGFTPIGVRANYAPRG